MHGNLQGLDDLHVSGQVNGNIRCCRLAVDVGGRIAGNIIADEIIVKGTIKGIIRAKSVILQDTAHVDGEIYYVLLAIERGARLDGIIRRRENPVQCNDEEIVAAAAEGGADPISLKYLIRPLLALRDADRGDPVMWAKELSLIAGCHDSEVLSETARRMAAAAASADHKGNREARRDRPEIGGQKVYLRPCTVVLGAREWNPESVAGQRGCACGATSRTHNGGKLSSSCTVFTRQEEGLMSLPTWSASRSFTRSAQPGLPIDVACIPGERRVEFGIPAIMKEEVARVLLQSIEGSPLSEAVEPASWYDEVVAA
jgi:cytoskeletal protein CcmA (bactofilin family)